MPTKIESDIVITGISGRLPESSNIDEFKENLMKGIDMVTEDERRWIPGTLEIPSRFAKLKDLGNFDAAFFKLHPKQVDSMDPQLRIMLEVTYEAIIDAGVNPSTLKGSRTGVFIGVSASDANNYWKRNPNGYGMLGCSRAMFANRISYVFDLIGPSYSMDTACSSALTAMHQAVVAMKTGECDAAIIGGLNIILDPAYSLHFHRLNMLSKDGKCKSFDITADGYARAEAVVVIFLQKSKDARRVYATVMNTAINTDGYKSEGFTYPNGDIQYLMLQKVYSEVGINPEDVVYVEAHGSGTKVGDPEELGAIDRLFCKNRKTPLQIGSVKSNMGHSEPASGLCSIAKVLIAMEAGVIPANLHFAIPNPKIPALTEGRIRVIDKATPWNGGLVGINSFGAGGANSHVILRSNPKEKISPVPETVKLLPKLIAVSGRTKEAIQVLLDKANEHRQDDEFLSLLHIAHNDNIAGHNIRGYEILAHDGTRETVEMNDDQKRPIWFIFPGMNTQWSGMGRELLNIKTCQHSLQQCANVLKNHDVDLMNIILNGNDETYDNVMIANVSIVAIQIALVDLLTLIGIQPDGIIGHSLGELSCSYADGAFTLEQTILAAYYKGKSILDSDLELGAMAVVSLNWEEAKEMCPPDITPACHNSANSVTISGSPESVQKFVEELKSRDIFTKIINSSGVAFHSKYIAPIESKYRASLDMIIPKPKQRSARWISSSIPEAAWDSPLAQFSSSDYHVNNTLSPVLFQEAVAHIPENAITIEIAPHCLLQSILRSSLPSTVTNISLQKQNYSNNLIYLLSNVGKLYMAGAQPDISKLYPPISFPVSRGTPMIGPLIKWYHSTTWEVPNFSQKSKQLSGRYVVKVNLSTETDAYLAGHKIDGRYVFPGAGLLMMVWKTFAKLHDTDFEQLPIILENVWFQRVTFVPEKKTIKFSVSILERKGDFEVREADSIVVSGNIRSVAEAVEIDQPALPPLPMPPGGFSLNTDDIYKELRLRGYEYNGIFEGIKSCDRSITVGELYWFNEWTAYMDTMFQFKLLSIDRRLVYGSKVRYAMFDPVLHKRLTNELPKSAGLPVYYYKNLDIVKSGGIELRGMISTTPQRQQIQIKPKYERYVFVPYKNPRSLALENSRQKLHALTVLLQIACENITTSRIKAMEIANNRDVRNLLAPLILDIFDGEPLVNIDLQVAVNSTIDDYTTSCNDMNINVRVVAWDVNDAFVGPNMHLVIATEVLSGQSYTVLKNLAGALNPSCFILLEETATQLDLKTALKEANLMLVGKQIDSSGKSYILLRKRRENREPIVIQITGKNLVWLENAKAMLKKYDNNQEALFVSQGEELFGLVGFMTCIRREIVNMRYIFIQDSNAPKFDLSSQFYKQQLEKGLMANILREGQWGSYRHLQLDQHNGNVRVEHAYVRARTAGDLSSLEWIQSSLTGYQIKYSDRLCSVYYASLNFRDIALAVGQQSTNDLSELDAEDLALGLEFSGRDANGYRVMGIAQSRGLVTTVLPDSSFLWKVPDRWTLEQAATIPVAYMISYYALFIRGRLKASESVLIHSGAGGIGQAAITIALHAGCTVFTTAGTPEKRQFLKNTFPQLSEKHIGNSRDTSFEHLISDQTGGRGVDVVLNSLAEEKLHASMRCLAKNGRFLEIGKYGMLNGNRVDMSMFLRNISFHGILLETLLEGGKDKQETLELMLEGIEKGVVRPLTTTVFPKRNLEEGFRFITTGQHIGKVLLKIRHEEQRKQMLPMSRIMTAVSCSYMNPEKSYVLIGGLGGFGLELANWMVVHGARIIVLVSRTGIRTGYQMLRVQHWRESGVKVVVSTIDVTKLSGALRLIEESNRLAPVGGIFNLAAVLHDALFVNLQVTDFEAVNLPKIEATKNLDIVSRRFSRSLDYFVVFSSVSCGRGNPGQSNYGFANSAMERMMEQRHAAGLPGLAIQWGIVGDVGLYVDTMKNKNIDGILPQRISSCLATMDIFLRESHPVLASTVIAEKQKSANDGKVDFVQVIANIFGIENVYSINFNDSFDKLGIDSLGYTEIKQILQRECNIILSFREIQALTISKLRDLLAASDAPDNSSTS